MSRDYSKEQLKGFKNHSSILLEHRICSELSETFYMSGDFMLFYTFTAQYACVVLSPTLTKNLISFQGEF